MSRSVVLSSVRRLRSLMAAQQGNEQSDEQLLSAFAQRREEIAFAALVRRHGPMVLSVCRRVLEHEQDAEDAFQATFLVLAQRAASLRNKSALASFLHGTAYHLASKAKRAAGRRRKYEGQAPARSFVNPSEKLYWSEVRLLLDEEVARLPDKYRSIFILCCLEELSQAEAGRRLGLKESTVANRLAQARKQLSQRLPARGVELTAVLAASTLAASSASALPAGLMATTIEAGLSGAVSLAVAELVQGATTAMVVGKAKMVTVMLLAVGMLAGAGMCAYRGLAVSTLSPSVQLAGPPADKADDKPQATPPRAEAAKTVSIQGRVLDPKGKPLQGAKLVFTYPSGTRIPHKIWAVSAAEGRFAFTVPIKEVDNGYTKNPWENAVVTATAEGYGFAAARLGKPPAADLTLRLVRDDKPIRGRIIDLQGKPIAGVRIRVADLVGIPKKGDLTDWLAALKADKDSPPATDRKYLMWVQVLDSLLPPATTGADGRFEMTGIGRERLADLRIEGPTIATQEVKAMTRASETIRLPQSKDFPKRERITYYGADFEHLAAPGRPIAGVVRDKDTGKPLAGVTIESNSIANIFHAGFLRTTTDKDGRYRLLGMPKGDGNKIAARAVDYVIQAGSETPSQLPYLPAVKTVGNPLGLEPVTVDFALKRGVWVTGHITDKNTSNPLWAGIEYFCFADNPNAKEIQFGLRYNWCSSRWDGLFRIPALPGHGLIAVRAYDPHYITGAGADRIKGPRSRDGSDFVTRPYFSNPVNWHALVEIAPQAGEEAITCNFALEKGRSLKGTVLDPDGKPLAGVRLFGLKNLGSEENAGPDFTVESLQPNKPRLLRFIHEGRKLAGSLLIRGDEKDPLRVQLQPWGTITGRILTPLSKPLTSVRVNCFPVVTHEGKSIALLPLSAWPAKDGRFRIEGLAAGVNYELRVSRSNLGQTIAGGKPKDLTVKAGETKDMGDLTVKPTE